MTYRSLNDNKFEARNTSEVFVCDTMLSHKEGDPICIVFPSKTCLRYLNLSMSYSKLTLVIDDTFKVNNLGYPLICLVTQDANQRIYPLAFAPASTESGATISFVLQAVSKV